MRIDVTNRKTFGKKNYCDITILKAGIIIENNIASLYMGIFDEEEIITGPIVEVRLKNHILTFINDKLEVFSVYVPKTDVRAWLMIAWRIINTNSNITSLSFFNDLCDEEEQLLLTDYKDVEEMIKSFLS